MTKLVLRLVTISSFLIFSVGVATAEKGIWMASAELAELPMGGFAWDALKARADADPGQADLANQNHPHNTNVLAMALVYARTGDESYRQRAIPEIMEIIETENDGRTLALGRNLAAYIIAADLIGLPAAEDRIFRDWLRAVRYENLNGFTLISTHEKRPNNWGNMAGASRAAAAIYLGDTADLERTAQVFQGWLGDRTAYSERSVPGFRYGALNWQCDPERPVGINPVGCTTSEGFSLDGVQPEEMRRSGLDPSTWPPPKEPYAYEGLQGAIVQAEILYRAGYDTWNWENQALLRAFRWLYEQADFPAEGDDVWQPWLVNFRYGTNLPTVTPARAGKNMGWTDWTHQRIRPDAESVSLRDRPPVPGIWIHSSEAARLPMSGPAWKALKARADTDPGQGDLANQDQSHNTNVLAMALVYARTGDASYRRRVIPEIMEVLETENGGRPIALARNLAAYVIAAELVGLPPTEDQIFRQWLRDVRHEDLGGATLVSTHEKRPNNWGAMAGASRAAAAIYLGDSEDLERTAHVFKGWLGDRDAYSEQSYPGFRYGALDWQCDPERPIGINPEGCSTIEGFSLDGVQPEEMRRSGPFTWPPPKEPNAWEGLQGAIVQAEILYRAGYDTWNWSNRALLRAFRWLYFEADFPAEGDDAWQPWVANFRYGTNFPAVSPARVGKNMGWTDWTHQ